MPHEPFDAAALAKAEILARRAGKPCTRELGLRAIHAVLQRQHFANDKDAYEEYGVSKQRYSEWKAQLLKLPPTPPPSPPRMPRMPFGWQGDFSGWHGRADCCLSSRCRCP